MNSVHTPYTDFVPPHIHYNFIISSGSFLFDGYGLQLIKLKI